MRNNNITQDTSCIKVVLVGESNTGKTSIINRFCSDIFNEETHVTVGCSCLSRTIEVAPYQKVKLKIWDTAGQETYRSINKIFYKEAKIVIFVYDITNIKSFKEIGSYWLHEVKNTVDEDTVLAIVGNKSDLYINEDISEEVVYNFAHEHGLLFKLVSAKKNLAINELFKEITTLYLQGPSVNDKSTNTINLRNDECKEQHNKKTCC